jgi:hypothetical protein
LLAKYHMTNCNPNKVPLKPPWTYMKSQLVCLSNSTLRL